MRNHCYGNQHVKFAQPAPADVAHSVMHPKANAQSQRLQACKGKSQHHSTLALERTPPEVKKVRWIKLLRSIWNKMKLQLIVVNNMPGWKRIISSLDTQLVPQKKRDYNQDFFPLSSLFSNTNLRLCYLWKAALCHCRGLLSRRGLLSHQIHLWT